jgi:hypothetical protein
MIFHVAIDAQHGFAPHACFRFYIVVNLEKRLEILFSVRTAVEAFAELCPAVPILIRADKGLSILQHKICEALKYIQ